MTDVAGHDISTTETARQAAQERLDALRTAADRNRLGQFATPNPLAVEIARCLRDLVGERVAGLRFADPAVGTGSFFSAARAVFGSERIVSAAGVELDPAFAAAARELWAGHGLAVLPGDFTQLMAGGWCPPVPNLILANPPYVRHHHIGRSEKERLKHLTAERTGVAVNGLAGLYVYFLLLATAWMDDGGAAAWLVPSEFMDVNYGAALKRFLCDRVTLARVHRFDPDRVQFGDALVSSAVLFFHKTPSPPGHAVEFTFGGTVAEPETREAIPADRLRDARKWTLYPRHETNDRLASARGNGFVLGDFFRIQRGIATGCNKFFVLARADALRLGLPTAFLRPILPSPRHLKATVIDGDADGYPRIEGPLCVLDCDLAEAAVERDHPAL